MTRPATLPELLAKGKVKPGDWVLDENGERWQVTERRIEHMHCSDLCGHKLVGTFIPVNSAKAKKWGDWERPTDGATLADHMHDQTGMQVRRTRRGLKIRYRVQK